MEYFLTVFNTIFCIYNIIIYRRFLKVFKIENKQIIIKCLYAVNFHVHISCVGKPGFTCWIFFCSGIQFYLLLSSYLCSISLLYLDLYV